MTTPPTYRPRKYISYSTLMEFIRCPRRYFYSKCGITPKGEATALHYGTAMHKAVPEALTTSDLDAALRAFDSAWNPELDDTKHSRAHAIRSLANLIHTHTKGRGIYNILPPPPPPPGVTLTEERSPHEILFTLDVGLRVPILGWLDGWCQHRDTGEYWAWELKTMSRMTSSLFDSLEFNPQILTYVLVCRTMTERHIRGVMFEGVLKDTKKVDNITHPVPVEDHMVDSIVMWLRYWGELLLACEDRALATVKFNEEHGVSIDPVDAFPKNFAGCSAYPLFYMPGSSCDYTLLCRRESYLDNLPHFDIKPEHTVVELTLGETS